MSMGNLYPVERIIGKKSIAGRVHYLIKWKDYDEDEATWEMFANLRHIRPLIMEYNARIRMDQQHLQARRNAEQYASRRIDMKNERDERENDLMRMHRMASDVCKIAPRSRIEVNSNKNMSILSLLEDQLRNEDEKWGQKIRHQSQKIYKEEEKKLESSQLSQDMNDCLTEVSQEEESAGSEYEEEKVVNQKKIRPVSMNLPNTRLTRSRVEKSLRDVSSISSEIDDSSSMELEEEPKMKTRKDCKGRIGVPAVRMSVVKRKDRKGMEYFVEDKSGKLNRYSGKEVIAYYPEDFLAFAEAIISKYMP